MRRLSIVLLLLVSVLGSCAPAVSADVGVFVTPGISAPVTLSVSYCWEDEVYDDDGAPACAMSVGLLDGVTVMDDWAWETQVMDAEKDVGPGRGVLIYAEGSWGVASGSDAWCALTDPSAGDVERQITFVEDRLDCGPSTEHDEGDRVLVGGHLFERP